MTKLRKKCLSNLFSSKLDHLKKKFTTIMKRSRLNDRNPTQLILSIFLFWERRFSSNKKLTLKHFFGGKKLNPFEGGNAIYSVISFAAEKRRHLPN